jgi:hypothetical protein
MAESYKCFTGAREKMTDARFNGKPNPFNKAKLHRDADVARVFGRHAEGKLAQEIFTSNPELYFSMREQAVDLKLVDAVNRSHRNPAPKVAPAAPKLAEPVYSYEETKLMYCRDINKDPGMTIGKLIQSGDALTAELFRRSAVLHGIIPDRKPTLTPQFEAAVEEKGKAILAGKRILERSAKEAELAKEQSALDARKRALRDPDAAEPVVEPEVPKTESQILAERQEELRNAVRDTQDKDKN